ncbi:hypothetical protein C0991_004264, partial [Blastosporella zonata]
MASSSNTLLANLLCALSLAVTANLSYTTASRDKESAQEVLEFATKALQLWK